MESYGKDIMVQTVFYLDLSFLYVLLIKIDQCFLNGRYRLNHIVRDSNFLKTGKQKKSMNL